MNKTVHTYVCLVDYYRRPSRQRNTEGRYLVGATSEKEAKEFLQKAIGFGSVQVYYRATDDDGKLKSNTDKLMNYKEMCKVRITSGDDTKWMPVVHANAPRKER